jgi:DNA-binding response OmpR family regulator
MGHMKKRRVLVIDDDQELSGLIACTLRLAGHEARALGSALAAAGIARDYRPDLILLDVGLPYKSGLDLLATLKADAVTAPIPVILISGFPSVVPLARRALASHILTKPFGAQKLLEAIRDVTRSQDVPEHDRNSAVASLRRGSG